jgi:hypothetical protein
VHRMPNPALAPSLSPRARAPARARPRRTLPAPLRAARTPPRCRARPPAPRMPAADRALQRLRVGLRGVILAATFVGISPCSAMATRRRSRKKRSSSVGSRPVSKRWKYSVNVRRPMRSPARSRPRTATRSG